MVDIRNSTRFGRQGMNTLHIYIDKTLDTQSLNSLKTGLMGLDHVSDVEFHAQSPHDLVVEVDEHCNMPVNLMNYLNQQGVSPDITHC